MKWEDHSGGRTDLVLAYLLDIARSRLRTPLYMHGPPVNLRSVPQVVTQLR
jgi:hypothetical protein